MPEIMDEAIQGVPHSTTASTDEGSSPAPAPTLKLTAWCPDDCNESAALEYTSATVREIAEQHAEYVYWEGDRREFYDIRVRAVQGDRVREWDVAVDVETEVRFCGAVAFPVKPSKTPESPKLPESPLTEPAP